MAQIINYNEKTKKIKNERCKDILRNLEKKRKNFNTLVIIKTAENILKALDFYNIRNSIPIVKITEAFGLKPYKVKSDNNDIEGQLFINGTTKDIYGQDKVIVVNNKNDLYIMRFIIARQLAVFLFNFKENNEYKNKQNLFIYDYKGEFCKDYERFATEILMPTQMFLKQYIVAMEASNNIRFVIGYLSRYFKVPKYLVKRRIIELTE